ncbi:MAG: hypothetical protein V8S73_02915 [Lachnospiraceae bacterium]
MEKQKVLDQIKSSMMVLVEMGAGDFEKYHTREELLAFYQEIAEAVKREILLCGHAEHG